MRKHLPLFLEALEHFLESGDLHLEKKRHVLSTIIEMKEEYISTPRADPTLAFIDEETRKEIKRHRKTLKKMK